MVHEIDRLYYQQCAEKERMRAHVATDIAIKRTHENLAELYEKKVAAHTRLESGAAPVSETRA